MKIDIENLAMYQEDHRIEAKTAKSQIPNSIWESYSSFANTEGGIILLGVVEKEDHSLVVKGVEDAHKLVTDFWNIVSNRQKVSLNILTNNMVSVKEVDGKQIVVIEVPRAERTMRPVYIGQDPMAGTFVRYGEGDHLCNRDQVAAIYRDATATTTDTKVLKGLDMSVFDMNTVHDYRNYFNGKHPGHVWSKQDDERTINADDNVKTDDKRTINADDNVKTDDKPTIKPSTDDKLTIIVEYIRRNGEVKTEDLVKLLNSSTTRIKMLLYKLVEDGEIVPNGSNRNRTYKLKDAK